jgi:hypothetical protein
MSERELEELREENVRLRSALEEALLLVEQAPAGTEEGFEANVVRAVLREALAGGAQDS